MAPRDFRRSLPPRIRISQCSIARPRNAARHPGTGPRLANGSPDHSGVRMTAPVASLFMTPPDMGGQGAAPATGATAGSDSAFDALVSAFFEASEPTVPAAQIPPQAVPAPAQSPQSAGASTAPATDAVNPNGGTA